MPKKLSLFPLSPRTPSLEDALAPGVDEINQALAGQRISTRFPTAKAATEDPMGHDLIIDTRAMRDAGEKAFEKNTSLVTGYAPINTRVRKPDSRAQAFIEQGAENLLWLHDQVPGDVRDVTKQWYVGANKIAQELSGKYGVNLEEAGGVIAALSPQKDWYQNVSLAERVMNITTLARRGEYTTPDTEHLAKARQIYGKPQYQEDLKALESMPYEALTAEQKAMFVRSYDEAFNDRSYDIISPLGERVSKATTGSGKLGTAAWGSNAEIAKAIRVVEDPSIENISSQMGGQHKVRNFYNNIVDPFSDLGDFTSDTHNVAATLLQPLGGSAKEATHNFGGTGSASSALTGAQGTYGLYADAGRMAARERGIMPREMQSITWEAVRDLFPATFKSNKGNVEDIESVWNLHKKGDITKDHARELILEKAGGMDGPDWVERPDSGIHVPSRTTADEVGLRQPGVSRSGGVDRRVGLVGAGVPATWLGLGGAGLLGSDEAEALPTQPGGRFKQLRNSLTPSQSEVEQGVDYEQKTRTEADYGALASYAGKNILYGMADIYNRATGGKSDDANMARWDWLTGASEPMEESAEMALYRLMSEPQIKKFAVDNPRIAEMLGFVWKGAMAAEEMVQSIEDPQMRAIAELALP